MTAKRGVLIAGGAALLAAWFAAAADRDRQAVPESAGGETSLLDRTDALSREIQSQSTRLRSRLAHAPEPAGSGRNPFAFDTPRVAPPSRPPMLIPAAGSPAAIDIAEPPPLTLSGIAEEEGAGELAGTRWRVAVLSGFGDVYLARAGDTVLSRFEVVQVGADAAELKDLTTGRTIRLGLR
jgi:hypothetical protein